MKYANRDNEFKEIKKHIKKGTKLIFINASPACGVTSFTTKKVNEIPEIKNGIKYYLNAKNEAYFNKALFREIMQDDTQRRLLQSLADKELGSKKNNLFRAALQGIPYAGDFLSALFESKEAIPLYTGDYSTAIGGVLYPYFRRLTKNSKCIIFIDSAQSLTEDSFENILNLMELKNITFIFIITEKNSESLKLKNYFKQFKTKISSGEVSFVEPQIDLIIKLGELYGYSLNETQAEQIINGAKRNIHNIIDSITRDDAKTYSFSENEKAIVSILHICKFSLKQKLLFDLLKTTTVFALKPDIAFTSSLSQLCEDNIIKCNNSVYSLQSFHHPEVKNILNSFPDQLFYKQCIFDFFNKSEDRENYAELLHALSCELGTPNKEYAKIHMRNLVIAGEVVSENIFNNAQLEKGSVYDSTLAAIMLCRERKYQEALKWLSSIELEQSNNDINKLKAVLLNRTRQHEAAEQALLNCIKIEENSDKKYLLAAFLISNYIHTEKLDLANEVYERMLTMGEKTPNYAYFLRNATSIFRERPLYIYDEALTMFKTFDDEFGYYTTLCNKSIALAQNNRLKEALLALQQSAVGLSKYGSYNLHIVYNNLGICYLLTKKYDEAFQYLNLAKNLGKNSMPIIWSKINLACLYAFNGKLDDAYSLITSIEVDVENHVLDRVRQKYYINRLFIEYITGNKKINFYIEKSSQYPDRYNPEETRHLLNFYKRVVNDKEEINSKNWLKLYSPCWLSYWYLDPLKLFSNYIVN